jgi:hypothetical protein
MGTNKDLLSRIGMGAFLLFIVIFVSLSSWIYFNNSTNVAIRIQSDNEINKEKTAVNEALTKTLVQKNDTISTIKIETRKRDSILFKKIDVVEKKLKKSEHQKDSLQKIINRLKQSDIQPITRNPGN